MSMYNFKLYSTTSTKIETGKMPNKPSRAAPPPPVPSHAKNDRNNNNNNSHRPTRDGVAKIPTVIRPKMVETPKKRAPPRPPPPLIDASFVPTRTSSLNRSLPPPVPPPPKNKLWKQRKRHLNARTLKKVKIFGRSSTKSASSNANEEFFTATMGNGRFGGSYTNQALAQPSRGKKQAPMPPRDFANFGGSQVATGMLISFATPPSSPNCAAPPVLNVSQNVQSLLDIDFPEPNRAGGASLLDMDNPPMISTSFSVDNFGSTPFDPFQSEPQRKASLPITASSKVTQPMIRTPEALGRINQIREEWSSPHEGSPPPPKCPAPQLNPLDTSAVTTQPCGMALEDYTNPKKGELAFSQYDLIELLSEHDDFYYLGRLDDQNGLVRKDAVEVLTPLEESQQDSEPESQQDAENRPRPSTSTATGVDDKPDTERCFSQKPVASVSLFTNHVGQNEDAENAVALYNFEAQQEDELSFSAGDRLLVTSRCDQDWLYGCTVKDSRFGIFPASFVQIGSESGSETESLKEVEESNNCENKQHVNGTGHENKSIVATDHTSAGRPVIAIFGFSPEQEGDLGFEEGESIIVLSRVNKDWLMGKNSKGETGQFPASFVQLTDASESPNYKAQKEFGLYVCVFDFEAQQTDDLTIRAGDKIRVTEKKSEEWWQGHVLGVKHEGIFPSNFVEPL